MRSAFATLALSAFAIANSTPDREYGFNALRSADPEGCKEDYQGQFTINQVNVSSKSYTRSIMPRDEDLILELHGGVLKDTKGRTGYIANNYQFQFDEPPQAGARETSGFSVCANGSLALNSAIWRSCRSGKFYNLYSQNDAAQCIDVYLVAVGGAGAETTGTPNGSEPTETMTSAAGYTSAATTSAASAATGSAAGNATGECTQYVDGQPQCTEPASTPSCGEGSDGQPQCSSAPTATPPPAPVATAPTPSGGCGQMGDGQPNCGQPTYTGAPITPAPNAANAFGVQYQMFGLAAGVLALVVF